MEISTPNGQVISGPWVRSQGSHFPAIVAEELGASISGVIRVADQKNPSDLGKADFYVLVYQSPIGGYREKMPSKLFGIEVCKSQEAGKVSDKGTQFTDDSGAVVAELVDNALYIRHYINGCGCGSERKLFRRILQEVVQALKPAWHPGDPIQELSGDLFQEVWSPLARRIADLQESSKTSTDELAKAKEQATAQSGSILVKTSTLHALRGLNMDDVLLESEADIRTLIADSRIAGIATDKHYLHVFTKDLWAWCTPRSMRYRLGRYRIQIPFNGSLSGLKVFTTRYRINTYYHSRRQAPHVGSDGNPCWGNAESTFTELLSARDFVGVVHYMLQYLQSVNNPDEWGDEINKWPEDQKPEKSNSTVQREKLLTRLSPGLKHLTPEQLDHWLFQLDEERMARIGELIDRALQTDINWEVEWIGKGLSLDTLFSSQFTQTLPALAATAQKTPKDTAHAAV